VRTRDPRITKECSPELIAVARIIKERGIKGEVRALPLSVAALAIPELTEVEILSRSGNQETFKIRSFRSDKDSLILAFEGIDRREDASRLRDAVIQIQKKFLPPLQENEYYHWQIIGLKVITAAGEIVGEVTDIMETGTNDIYVVQGAGREVLIPAVKDMVSAIDLDAGTVTITPIEGLLD
jgi:16S rRNA processing protein RimM